MESQPYQSAYEPRTEGLSPYQKYMNPGFLGTFFAGTVSSWFGSLKVKDWAIDYFKEKPNKEIYQYDYTGGWEAFKINMDRGFARLADFSMWKSSAASWLALGAGIIASASVAKILFVKERAVRLPVGPESLPNYAAMPLVPPQAMPASPPAANDPAIVNRVSHQGTVATQQQIQEMAK